jgi:hypothetical protein
VLYWDIWYVNACVRHICVVSVLISLKYYTQNTQMACCYMAQANSRIRAHYIYKYITYKSLCKSKEETPFFIARLLINVFITL